MLARLENRAVAALPPAYVARLFDDYAPRFDRHLTQTLGYRGPELIVSALDSGGAGAPLRARRSISAAARGWRAAL